MAKYAITNKLENYNSHEMLGFKVKLANGIEAIITVIHALSSFFIRAQRFFGLQIGFQRQKKLY